MDKSLLNTYLLACLSFLQNVSPFTSPEVMSVSHNPSESQTNEKWIEFILNDEKNMTVDEFMEDVGRSLCCEMSAEYSATFLDRLMKSVSNKCSTEDLYLKNQTPKKILCHPELLRKISFDRLTENEIPKNPEYHNSWHIFKSILLNIYVSEYFPEDKGIIFIPGALSIKSGPEIHFFHPIKKISSATDEHSSMQLSLSSFYDPINKNNHYLLSSSLYFDFSADQVSLIS